MVSQSVAGSRGEIESARKILDAGPVASLEEAAHGIVRAYSDCVERHKQQVANLEHDLNQQIAFCEHNKQVVAEWIDKHNKLEAELASFRKAFDWWWDI